MNLHMDNLEKVFRRFVKSKAPTDLTTRHWENMSLMGLSGEVGELVDAFKKHYYYDKPLDKENVKEELGDIFHYFTSLLIINGLTLTDVVDANITKLNKRYPKGFNREDAIARKDKVDQGPEHVNCKCSLVSYPAYCKHKAGKK